MKIPSGDFLGDTRINLLGLHARLPLADLPTMLHASGPSCIVGGLHDSPRLQVSPRMTIARKNPPYTLYESVSVRLNVV